MIISFDPNKERLNIKNHGIPLQKAKEMEWDTFISREDRRFAYGEIRMSGLGFIGLRLYNFVYVEQSDEHWRAISLRPATKQEMKYYAEA
uniref:BrnT family toxin n=1 Tax=uncultured Thiotrichaceae bacterium TaxID=298394 RepID=A0A6S6UNY7_9GAMM|nr:MAG: Unknown protein [uncultured Thiotrichaceae bacterium]